MSPLYVLFAQNKLFVTWGFSCLAGCLYFLRFRLLKAACRFCWQFIVVKGLTVFSGLFVAYRLELHVDLTPVKGWKRYLTIGSTATNSSRSVQTDRKLSQIFQLSSGLFWHLYKQTFCDQNNWCPAHLINILCNIISIFLRELIGWFVPSDKGSFTLLFLSY